MRQKYIALWVGVCLLSACAAPTNAPAPSNSSSASSPTSAPSTSAKTAAATTSADLSGIKTYLLDKGAALKKSTTTLKEIGERYYQLAQVAKFDYTQLADAQKAEAVALVQQGRDTWRAASPLYEQMEGIVAGVPMLAEYDVILDAGASADEDPSNAVPFDLTLPDGRVLKKPGNLFGVTESALFGTFADYASQAKVDIDANGAVGFGDVLPEANVLKAATSELDRYAGELQQAAQQWQPSESDAFTALVAMIPTMDEYFASWKDSRFVIGEQSKQRDFVAISRLADIQDILSSLQVVHLGVSPLIKNADAAQDEQIGQRLAQLKQYVSDIHAQEKGGKRFTPEEADTLGKEAQDRATAVTGQITQMAAKLKIDIQQ